MGSGADTVKGTASRPITSPKARPRHWGRGVVGISARGRFDGDFVTWMVCGVYMFAQGLGRG